MVVVVAAVSTVVVVSMGEVSVAVVSMEDVSAVAVSTAVAFVAAVSAVAVSTAVAFVVTVLVITDSLMMSSSATSAFPGGGAGAIRTDITVTTTTHTVTLDTASMVITVTAVTDAIIRAEITRAVVHRIRVACTINMHHRINGMGQLEFEKKTSASPRRLLSFSLSRKRGRITSRAALQNPTLAQ